MKHKQQPRNAAKETALTERLNAFHAAREVGKEYGLREIADACQCSYQNIHQIEKRALQHARELFTEELRGETPKG